VIEPIVGGVDPEESSTFHDVDFPLGSYRYIQGIQGALHGVGPANTGYSFFTRDDSPFLKRRVIALNGSMLSVDSIDLSVSPYSTEHPEQSVRISPFQIVRMRALHLTIGGEIDLATSTSRMALTLAPHLIVLVFDGQLQFKDRVLFGIIGW